MDKWRYRVTNITRKVAYIFTSRRFRIKIVLRGSCLIDKIILRLRILPSGSHRPPKTLLHWLTTILVLLVIAIKSIQIFELVRTLTIHCKIRHRILLKIIIIIMLLKWSQQFSYELKLIDLLTSTLFLELVAGIFSMSFLFAVTTMQSTIARHIHGLVFYTKAL